MPKEFLINGIERMMYTSGDLAGMLDRQRQTIRKWEAAGIIPRATFRSKSGRRLYTEEQVKAIVDTVEKYGLRQGLGIPKEFVEEVTEKFKEATPKLS